MWKGQSTMADDPQLQPYDTALKSFDSLLEQDSYVHEQRDRGRIEGLQSGVIAVVEARFPALVAFAQQQVVLLNQPDELSRLTKQIAAAPDETIARWLLSTYSA